MIFPLKMTRFIVKWTFSEVTKMAKFGFSRSLHYVKHCLDFSENNFIVKNISKKSFKPGHFNAKIILTLPIYRASAPTL